MMTADRPFWRVEARLPNEDRWEIVTESYTWDKAAKKHETLVNRGIRATIYRVS